MEELADRSEAGTLTADEEAEFDSYLHVANLLTVMHSEARLALRVGPADTRIRDDILTRSVWTRANHRCEYRHMPAAQYAGFFHVDHILARQHGGDRHLSNLALACMHCNRRKGPNIAGSDPETVEIVRLFDPRRDIWADHFEWYGPDLIGRTSIGRVTIQVLAINEPDFRAARAALRNEAVAEWD